MKIFGKRAPKQPENKPAGKSSSSGNVDKAAIISGEQEKSIFPTITENFEFLSNSIGDGIGLSEREYSVLGGKVKIGITYIESLVDVKLISSWIIEPVLKGEIDPETDLIDIPTLLQLKLIYSPDVKTIESLKQVMEKLMNGNAVLFIQNSDTALSIDCSRIEKRAVDKPVNEVTVLSSIDSFTEDLDTSCNMVIRRLPIPSLRFEAFTVGTLSQTKVKLIWLEGIANTKIIDEARRRIKSIDIDNINGMGTLAELIEDKPMSVFPKYKQTARPDIVAKRLAEGCFVVLCSNSQFAFVAPINLWDNFKIMDDYAERPLVASFLRIIRILSFLLATLVSPLYLAFVTYNHSIVPPALALNIASGREGVPFPSIVELLAMTFAVTIIHEASVRMQGSVGYFIGALAAVIIGQSAVSAGYVSASLIIVVLISAISSFAISSTTMVYPSRLIDFFLIFFAGTLGMFGLINGIAIVIWHMTCLKSFGMPYLYPVVPFDGELIKDTFFRAGLRSLDKRSRILAPFNRDRMGKVDASYTKGGRKGGGS